MLFLQFSFEVIWRLFVACFVIWQAGRKMMRPSAAVVNENLQIFIKDDRCLHVYNPDGTFVGLIGAGELTRPYGKWHWCTCCSWSQASVAQLRSIVLQCVPKFATMPSSMWMSIEEESFIKTVIAFRMWGPINYYSKAITRMFCRNCGQLLKLSYYNENV